jgi:Zn-dependent peptidase ImmA (M78 family)
MAVTYGISLNHLILPNPIPFRKPDDYRTIANRQAVLTHATKIAIRTAFALQDNIDDLISNRERELIHERLSEVTLTENTEDIALRERNRLGVQPEDQVSWRSSYEAFRQWRRHIEQEGILVYLFNMSIGDCRGFSILEPLPAIVVNDREPTHHARIFTLLHEYGHILLRKPGISDESRGNNVEWFCNRLAAAILMPINLLREVLLLPPDAVEIDWTDKQIATAARKMHVSQAALAIRLETLGYARDRFADRFNFGRSTEEPKKKGKGRGPSMSWAERRLRSLGFAYSARVLTALRNKDISEVAAYRMLNAQPAHFAKIQTLIEVERATYAPTTAARR